MFQICEMVDEEVCTETDECIEVEENVCETVDEEQCKGEKDSNTSIANISALRIMSFSLVNMTEKSWFGVGFLALLERTA